MEYWAAPLIGFVAGVIVVGAIIAIDRKLDDPGRRAVGARHRRYLGHARLRVVHEPAAGGAERDRRGGLFYTGSFHQLGVQALGVAAAFTAVFTVSFGFWAIKKAYGLRVRPEEERYGLDIVEHGMWGYPEAFMPVPGSSTVPPAMPKGWPPRQPAPISSMATQSRREHDEEDRGDHPARAPRRCRTRSTSSACPA